MIFTETALAGAYLVAPERREDDRGYFARGWCRDEFTRHGLEPELVQLNIGFSHRRGTVRGLHYQLPPHAEIKFARCTRGAIFDVIVDLRPESPTRGRWVGAELSADNGLMLYVPRGFAHGYQALTDDAEMSYLTSAYYAAQAARGVRYDDPAFAIRWPLPVAMVSAADASWPDYRPEPDPRADPKADPR